MARAEDAVMMNDSGKKKRRAGLSLRLRVSLWNAAVVTTTLMALTLAAIHRERRQIVRTESANADALLAHLASMPEFQRDVATVSAHLERMRRSLRASGDGLALVARPDAAAAAQNAWDGGIVTTRRLSLREGEFDLRYLRDPQRLRKALRRSVAMHLSYGFIALVALIAGTEWILRSNLVGPLLLLSRQLDHMRDGRGWLPRVLHTDQELAVVARAVGDLGPALARQVDEWIQAERRAAVALAIGRIRARLGEAHVGASGDATGLEVVRAERDRIAGALAAEEATAFASRTPTATGG